MKLAIKNSLVLLTFSLLLFQCGQSEPVAEEEHALEEEAHGQHEEEGNEDVVELSDVQLASIDLEYGPLDNINVSAFVKTNGILDLPPQNLAAVSAPVDGIVRRANFLVGNYVKKGTVLAMLENMDYVKYQEEYQNVLSNLNYLEAEYQRQRRLDSAQVNSKQQFQAATAAYENARSRKKSLEAQLRFLGISPASVAKGSISSTIPVRAPINGYIIKMSVHNGEFANSEQELYELADTRHMHIELSVFEQDANKVGIGQPIRFTVPSVGPKTYEGEVFLVGKSFDQENKTVKVHGHIEGEHPEFIRGLYVEAKIFTGSQQVLALPEEAIVEDEGKSYIFVRTEDTHSEEEKTAHAAVSQGAEEEEHGHEESSEAGEVHGTSFKRVQVVTGEKDQGYVQILQAPELPSDVEIVTKGTYYLFSEMKKGAGGHHH